MCSAFCLGRVGVTPKWSVGSAQDRSVPARRDHRGRDIGDKLGGHWPDRELAVLIGCVAAEGRRNMDDVRVAALRDRLAFAP